MSNHGDPPSSRQMKILYASARAQADRRDAYGPTVIEGIIACWNYAGLQVSKSQYRDHMRELEKKGYAYRHDRRGVGGEFTWQVNDDGRIELLNLLMPEISQWGEWAGRIHTDGPEEWVKDRDYFL